MNKSITKAVSILVTGLLLHSCMNIEFEEAQPINAQLLQEFPVELQGEWYQLETKESDSLETFHIKVTSKQVLVENIEPFERKSKLFHLSDSVQLYKKKNLYTFNTKTGGVWDFFILEVLENESIKIGFLNENLDLLLKDKNLEVEYTAKNEKEVDLPIDSLNAEHMDHIKFSGQMKYKTLRALMDNSTSLFLTKDGDISRK